MSQREVPWGWVIVLLLGLYFLGLNIADGDWVMVGLALFVTLFAAMRIIRRRTPPGAAR
ncbi:hypothetical protein [Nocardioides caricicola]|uniref:DUF4175 domain-containing protein n=1 Tax=Nocardioides caricicola TaxID=634770 RepID=A0ABW0N181_9ACTN